MLYEVITFISIIPRKVAKNPSNNVPAIYDIPKRYCPSLIKFSVSRENEEKVVKPPQNPVTSRSFASVDIISDLELKPKT